MKTYFTCQGPAGQSRTLLNEHTGRSQLRAPLSCTQLLPSLSAAHRPQAHSPPPPVQSLIKQSDMSKRQRKPSGGIVCVSMRKG